MASRLILFSCPTNFHAQLILKPSSQKVARSYRTDYPDEKFPSDFHKTTPNFNMQTKLTLASSIREISARKSTVSVSCRIFSSLFWLLANFSANSSHSSFVEQASDQDRLGLGPPSQLNPAHPTSSSTSFSSCSVRLSDSLH